MGTSLTFIITGLALMCVGGLIFLVMHIIRKYRKSHAKEKNLLELMADNMGKMKRVMRKITASIIGVLFVGVGFTVFMVGLGSFATDLAYEEYASVGFSGDTNNSECICMANCVPSIDLDDTNFDENYLWANGFYLTHLPTEAKNFMTYALYTEQFALMNSSVTVSVYKCEDYSQSQYFSSDLPVYVIKTLTDFYSSNFDITEPEIRDGLLFVPISVNLPLEEPKFVGVCVVDIGFYSGKLGMQNEDIMGDIVAVVQRNVMLNFLANGTGLSTGSVTDLIFSTSSIVNAINSGRATIDAIAALNGVDMSGVNLQESHLFMRGVDAEEWAEHPEISSLLGLQYQVIYDFARNYTTSLDKVRSIDHAIAQLARAYYNGVALNDMPDGEYYTDLFDSTDGHLLNESDLAYAMYYENWVEKYGDDDASLSRMIYNIMGDNKRNGVCHLCGVCDADYHGCLGHSWYIDYTDIFTFLELMEVELNRDIGFDSVSGNNGGQLGSASGKYAWSCADLSGRSYYTIYQTARTSSIVCAYTQQELVPSTVINGVTYYDGQSAQSSIYPNLPESGGYNGFYLYRGDNNTSQGKCLGASGCGLYSLCNVISNLTGTTVTPLQLLYEDNRLDIENRVIRAEEGSGFVVEFMNSGGGNRNYRQVSEYLSPYGITVYSGGNVEQVKQFLMSDSVDAVYTTCTPFAASEETIWYDVNGNVSPNEHGGISGHYYCIVDYDPVTNKYLVISDAHYYKHVAWVPAMQAEAAICNGSACNFLCTIPSSNSSNSGSSDSAVHVTPDSYPGPADTEANRTDSYLTSNIQLGSRRFDGSWYTEVLGWTADATPVELPGTDGKIGYESIPLEFDGTKQHTYYYDFHYARNDMGDWVRATADNFGIDFSGAYSSAFSSSHVGYTSSPIQSDANGIIYYGVATRADTCLDVSGIPVADTYWHMYEQDYSQLYATGHYFGSGFRVNSGTPNSILTAFASTSFQPLTWSNNAVRNATLILVVKHNETGNIYYLPVYRIDTAAHEYPFVAGETYLRVGPDIWTGQMVDGVSINDPNKLLYFAYAEGKNGDRMYNYLYYGNSSDTTIDIGLTSWGLGIECGEPYSRGSSHGFSGNGGMLATPLGDGKSSTVTLYDFMDYYAGNRNNIESPWASSPSTPFYVSQIEASFNLESILRSGYTPLGYLICR